jgi:hypothetical protein
VLGLERDITQVLGLERDTQVLDLEWDITLVLGLEWDIMTEREWICCLTQLG